jgi:hypothetical protein
MKSIKRAVAIWSARRHITRGQLEQWNRFDLGTRHDPIEDANQPIVIEAAPIFRD